jgi:ubiquinol-cytochrome c reductase subunit 6
MSQEDPVDKKEDIERECAESPKCLPVKERFESCTERVNNSPGTEETCVEEFFDLMHCIHECVSETIIILIQEPRESIS